MTDIRLPEMIVCAAVKFRVYIGELSPANYKDIAIPMVRHYSPDGCEVLDFFPDDALELEQGFLTNRSRFVNREEAMKIAMANNQIRRWSSTPFNKELFSEDLY